MWIAGETFITMISVLSALMEKAYNIQEQMGKCKQRGGDYKKESEGNVRRKYAVTEMKNAFDLFVGN